MSMKAPGVHAIGWALRCAQAPARRAQAASRPGAAGQGMARQVPPGRMGRMQAGPPVLSSPVAVGQLWQGFQGTCGSKPVGAHTWARLQHLVQDGGDITTGSWVLLGFFLQAPEEGWARPLQDNSRDHALNSKARNVRMVLTGR